MVDAWASVFWLRMFNNDIVFVFVTVNAMIRNPR
jgi:hypothetical protein